MGYSKKLIEEVKAVYPDFEKMHELAEAGSVWLGRYLDDSSTGSIPLDDILKAKSLADLQEKARVIKRKIDLYSMWCEEDPRIKQ
jgi:hypothetical protein